MQKLAGLGGEQRAIRISIGYETIWVAYKSSQNNRDFTRYFVELIADQIK